MILLCLGEWVGLSTWLWVRGWGYPGLLQVREANYPYCFGVRGWS